MSRIIFCVRASTCSDTLYFELFSCTFQIYFRALCQDRMKLISRKIYLILYYEEKDKEERKKRTVKMINFIDLKMKKMFQIFQKKNKKTEYIVFHVFLLGKIFLKKI